MVLLYTNFIRVSWLRNHNILSAFWWRYWLISFGLSMTYSKSDALCSFRKDRLLTVPLIKFTLSSEFDCLIIWISPRLNFWYNSLKGPVWENPSVVNMLTSPKHCWNLNESYFYILFSLFWGELRGKTSLLVRSKILGMFLDTLTADDKYSRHYRKNFAQLIEMQLCKMEKHFSQFFIAFPKCTWNSNRFS